jgi:hypothetical protein
VLTSVVAAISYSNAQIPSFFSNPNNFTWLLLKRKKYFRIFNFAFAAKSGYSYPLFQGDSIQKDKAQSEAG